MAPEAIRTMAGQVRAKLRALPNKAALSAQLRQVRTALSNCIDSIAKLGGSDTLLAKVRELEVQKASIEAQMSRNGKPAMLVPHVEKVLRERIRVLENIPCEDIPVDLKERAQAAVRDLLGQVRVVEEGDHIVAEVDLGRVVYNLGAEKRT